MVVSGPHPASSRLWVRHAERMTRHAERRNITSNAAAMSRSGQPASNSQTPTAASGTAKPSNTSLREHSHAEAMFTSPWRYGVNNHRQLPRSEEHTSELQSLMRNSYAVFCLKTKTKKQHIRQTPTT